jgi:O-antigen/teichoic acid export membrane protein
LARRPNIAAAAADVALALLALASGWAGAPLAYAGLVFLGAALVWAWTRRAALREMNRERLLTNTALALAMLAVVMAGAYWLGLQLRG